MSNQSIHLNSGTPSREFNLESSSRTEKYGRACQAARITLLIGILTLCGISGLQALNTTGGAVFVVMGCLLPLAALCLKSEKGHSSETEISRSTIQNAASVIQPEPSTQPNLPKELPKATPTSFLKEKFYTDSQYRMECLKEGSWHSADSAQNRDLIACCAKNNCHYAIENEKLPLNVRKDFYEVMRQDPNILKMFYISRCTPETIEIMDESDIAAIYGSFVITFYPEKGHQKVEGSAVARTKLLTAILNNYNLVEGGGDVVKFAVKLLQKAHRFADKQQRRKEIEFIFKIIFESKLDKKAFVKDFYSWGSNTISQEPLRKDFPACYVRWALKLPNNQGEGWIIEMFQYTRHVGFLTYLIPELEEDERKALREVFATIKDSRIVGSRAVLLGNFGTQ